MGDNNSVGSGLSLTTTRKIKKEIPSFKLMMDGTGIPGSAKFICFFFLHRKCNKVNKKSRLKF
jgi:hypothetical protein